MEKIWLKSYPTGVPEEINPDNYTSLADLFQHCCTEFADLPAFWHLGYQITYARLAEQAQAFANTVHHELGLEPGTRVALILPNCIQFPIALYGLWLAGCVVVATNPLYTPNELEHQLNDAGTEAVVILANFAHVLAEVLPATPIKQVIITQLGDAHPWPSRYLINFVVKYIKKLIPSYKIKGAIAWRQCIKHGKQLSKPALTLTADKLALLQYTGGTTGVAKGAMLTHRNLLANIEQAEAWIKPVLTSREEVIITALPMYHIFSLLANCLVFSKYGALNILITNPRDMNQFLSDIKFIPFTAITGVNTLFNGMLHHSRFKDLDFSHLKVALAGGMPLQKAVAKLWREKTQKNLVEAYGLTETSPAVCINPLDQTNYNGSIGLPIPSTDISIRSDTGEVLAINEAGELWVHGPQVMQGYWQNPEETAKVLTKDGWLKTGDIAKIDEQGYVYVIDRKKDMILVSGFNVYPNEVEQIIALHPGVLEVGVIGVASETSGEKIKAFIVKAYPNLTKPQIIAHCRQYLASYKIPKIIAFRDELPKSNVGKILRRALK